MFKPLSLSLALLAAGTVTAHAKMSVNKAQECQAVLDFTAERLASVKRYDDAHVKTVTAGLNKYNAFLQKEHVTPGLAAFTGGDAAATATYQTQIDAYKKQLVAQMNGTYTAGKIYTDQAVAIDGCYSAAPMPAADLPAMKHALETLVKLAQQN